MINSQNVKVTTTGGDGVATGSARVHFVGRIIAVVLYPHGSLPSTTDTTVSITKTGDSTVNVEQLIKFTDKGDSEGVIKFYPTVVVTNNSGVDISSSGSNRNQYMVTVTGIEVDVAQADALIDAVEIEVIYED